MPTVAQIEQALFQLAPKDLAFDWDNVGHLEGSPDQEVQRVLVALDVTENVVSEAEKLGCQLIVSHHPLMNVRWHQAEMQTLRPDRYLGRLLRRLVKADISVISMHTNLDIAPGGVNDALAEALRIEDPGPMPGDETGLCRVGRLRNPVKLSDFAGEVCKALHANGVRYAGDRPVEYIAVGGGACGDEIDAVIAAVNDEANLVEKEHKIDLIRWNEAAELATFDYFDVNAILSYLVRINIVARWTLLDAARGREMFARLLAELDGKELINKE